MSSSQKTKKTQDEGKDEMKEVVTLFTTELSCICPYCNSVEYGFIGDPSGKEIECDSCEKAYKVSAHADIEHGHPYSVPEMESVKSYMKKILKVFGGNWEGAERRIVATNSLSKAIELTGCKRNFICETGNELELAIALSIPGVVYGYSKKQVKSVKQASDFKVILDKKRDVNRQPSPICDSGCGSPAVSWFMKTSVIACGSAACVDIQNQRWKVHCAE